MGPLLALAIATADRLDPDHVGAPRRVAKAVVAAVAAKCHDSRMLDGDHYQAATWALGSCELDVVGLMVSAWQEGHFCAGTPSCPRGASLTQPIVAAPHWDKPPPSCWRLTP